jgi:hypothetical protein
VAGGALGRRAAAGRWLPPREGCGGAGPAAPRTSSARAAPHLQDGAAGRRAVGGRLAGRAVPVAGGRPGGLRLLLLLVERSRGGAGGVAAAEGLQACRAGEAWAHAAHGRGQAARGRAQRVAAAAAAGDGGGAGAHRRSRRCRHRAGLCAVHPLEPRACRGRQMRAQAGQRDCRATRLSTTGCLPWGCTACTPQRP